MRKGQQLYPLLNKYMPRALTQHIQHELSYSTCFSTQCWKLGARCRVPWFLPLPESPPHPCPSGLLSSCTLLSTGSKSLTFSNSSRDFRVLSCQVTPDSESQQIPSQGTASRQGVKVLGVRGTRTHGVQLQGQSQEKAGWGPNCGVPCLSCPRHPRPQDGITWSLCHSQLGVYPIYKVRCVLLLPIKGHKGMDTANPEEPPQGVSGRR